MEQMKRSLSIIIAFSVLAASVTGAVIYSQTTLNGDKSPASSLSPKPTPLPSLPAESQSSLPSYSSTPLPFNSSPPTTSTPVLPTQTPSAPADANALPTVPRDFDIIVPDDYESIQQAIDKAFDGSAILVKKGYYSEAVTINKELFLVGEDNQTTIIDANSSAPDLRILHDNVNVTGFHLVNTPIPALGNWMFSWEYVPAKQLQDIQINGAANCNIYGNVISNSSIGVEIVNSTNNKIIGNIFSNDGYAVGLSGENNLIANNLMVGGTGFKVASSHNNLLNNTITEDSLAIWLESGSNNTLKGNRLNGNFINFHIEAFALDNNADTSNTIEGKPIYYWIGESNATVPSDAGLVVVVNSTGITVKDCVLPLSGDGILLANTNYSTVQNNRLTTLNQSLLDQYHTPGVPLDILLLGSSNNQITGNQATIWLNSSSTNSLTKNTGVIRLFEAHDNNIVENTLTRIGFVGGDWSGIVLSHSSNNQITTNTITGNSAGIGVDEEATSNRIIENYISGNAQGGIVLGTMGPGTKNNLIFNNTITDNGNEGILDAAFGTQIIGNSIIKNRGNGLELGNSINCTITGNVIEGFFFGTFGNDAQNCTIVANNITINSRYGQYGIWFQSGTPGTFYHNNFLAPISFEHSDNIANIWDNGKDGNYWRFNDGEDLNGDGIGDTCYEIGPNNIDQYPLINSFDISKSIPKDPP
jgi:parallel beta-helix repeat protein